MVDFTPFVPQAIEYLLLLVLVVSILILGARRLHAKVYLFALQSLFLTLVLVCHGITHHSQEAIWTALLILLGKFILIPTALFKVLDVVPMSKKVESYFTVPTGMIIGGVLILLSHYLTSALFPLADPLFKEVFSVGTALVFIGLLMMMSFKKAFTQILGLYVMDNGIFCLTLATVFEMPLIMEMGILFELLLGILVLGVMVARIHQHFDSVNIDELQELRG
jgi:hydrogenase-4 component E